MLEILRFGTWACSIFYINVRKGRKAIIPVCTCFAHTGFQHAGEASDGINTGRTTSFQYCLEEHVTALLQEMRSRELEFWKNPNPLM